MPVEIAVPAVETERSLLRAVSNGILCRCPNCGKGRLFRSYLKVVDTCEHCGEELKWHRADDFPPYIAIFLVGHILVGYLLHQEMTQPLDPVIYLWTLLPLALILPLVMLPSIKGAVVGLQWANRMGGFDPARRPATGA